ncbi:MAG: hypothetical protein E5V52_02070, partial [Mesorhizobium sp.]
MIAAIAGGFKDGECIALKSVDPTKADNWADTLAADAVFATAFVKRDGSSGAAVLSEAGKILHSIDLPDRGHDVAFDPVSKRSVVFARQPG